MAHNFGEYEKYLSSGIRVEIGIPLAGGGVFRDWATVTDYSEDQLEVQISRDTFPANVRVDEGFILDVSVWVQKDVYTCGGIVTDVSRDKHLKIHIFGIFTLRERRQYFRIDAQFRVKYAISGEFSRDLVKNDWQQRRDLENMTIEGYDAFVAGAQKARFTPVEKLVWKDMPAANTTLSGGGIRLRFAQKMLPESLINLELHLPLVPPRTVHTVAEVVYSLDPAEGANQSLYPTGLKFIYLHERDRDLIFSYASIMQIAHLRKVGENRLQQDLVEVPTISWQVLVARVLWTIFFAILAFYFTKSLIKYKESGNSNEIKQFFEESIKTYRRE
jgi:hypothetical protein